MNSLDRVKLLQQFWPLSRWWQHYHV